MLPYYDSDIEAINSRAAAGRLSEGAAAAVAPASLSSSSSPVASFASSTAFSLSAAPSTSLHLPDSLPPLAAPAKWPVRAAPAGLTYSALAASVRRSGLPCVVALTGKSVIHSRRGDDETPYHQDASDLHDSFEMNVASSALGVLFVTPFSSELDNVSEQTRSAMTGNGDPAVVAWNSDGRNGPFILDSTSLLVCFSPNDLSVLLKGLSNWLDDDLGLSIRNVRRVPGIPVGGAPNLCELLVNETLLIAAVALHEEMHLLCDAWTNQSEKEWARSYGRGPNKFADGQSARSSKHETTAFVLGEKLELSSLHARNLFQAQCRSDLALFDAISRIKISASNEI